MLNLTLNITSKLHTDHLSLIYQTLGFTFTNTSLTYAVCGFIIVLCMLATTLRNLIYKVLNLAVLSVFAVALWAYLTDVTFIYVVYILTFVSAVVMLFLSVVLMLPSSAIAVTKRNSMPGLLFAIGTAENASVYGDVFVQIVYFSSLLIVILFFLYVATLRHTKNKFAFAVTKPGDALITKLNSFEKDPMLLTGQPLTYGISLPRFLSAALQRRKKLFIKKVRRIILDIYNFICDAPYIWRLGPELLKELAKDPVFKGRYTFFAIIRNFIPTCKKLLANLHFRLALLFSIFISKLQVLSAAMYTESGAQFIGSFSIFLIAVPSGTPGYASTVSYNTYFTEALVSNNLVENLAAIQHGLYIGEPLVTIVSITGLLVALIGAPFFISRGK